MFRNDRKRKPQASLGCCYIYLAPASRQTEDAILWVRNHDYEWEAFCSCLRDATRRREKGREGKGRGAHT